ncbi:hypothetical protein [methane-oxidizing endosymbiont of Gigantopelta aegis]|uniref:hypothetical protein n=1 Tax=methane-oxidizing endosymbiont of Gigantopelta aegis TaxID=2794938 RepID=UPI0018DE5298|nr:hypothetical protein [methane-oxidizing endosymbiont of Gigantopelta aegis]
MIQASTKSDFDKILDKFVQNLIQVRLAIFGTPGQTENLQDLSLTKPELLTPSVEKTNDQPKKIENNPKPVINKVKIRIGIMDCTELQTTTFD